LLHLENWLISLHLRKFWSMFFAETGTEIILQNEKIITSKIFIKCFGR
jgi:hypothetical protein